MGINLTKEDKDLYTKHYKTLNNIQINENISCVHGLAELILLKCPYYPKKSPDSV